MRQVFPPPTPSDCAPVPDPTSKHPPRRRQPEPPHIGERQNTEKRARNFVLVKEADDAAYREPRPLLTHMSSNPNVWQIANKKIPRAFGVTKRLSESRSEDYIGSITVKRDVKRNGQGEETETTNWYKNRRRKKGTIADRKNK